MRIRSLTWTWGSSSAWCLSSLLETRRTPRIDQSAISLQPPVRPSAGAQEFFLTATPGPKSAPRKDAARSGIIELRADGHSIDEIAVALSAEGLALNRTGIAEVISEHGLPRLWRRPDTARGGPRLEVLPRAELADFSQLPARSETNMAGLLLTIPDLLALDLPALVAAGGYPGTQVIPAINYLLSLRALKLIATHRVSHAVMHWGTDPAPEKHYVPSRSQRTRSVLAFFAEDADSHTLPYANADLFKATRQAKSCPLQIIGAT